MTRNVSILLSQSLLKDLFYLVVYNTQVPLSLSLIRCFIPSVIATAWAEPAQSQGFIAHVHMGAEVQ